MTDSAESSSVPAALGQSNSVDVSHEYTRSVPGSAKYESFQDFVNKHSAPVENLDTPSDLEGGNEAQAETSSEPSEVAESDLSVSHGDSPEPESEEGEAVGEPPSDEDTQGVSPLATIKAQIEALDIPPEQIAKELGLMVHSKQIRKLAKEMSKAKELQREAKKGTELVEQARWVLEQVKTDPANLIETVAGPDALTRMMYERAGEAEAEPDPLAGVDDKINERLQAELEARRQAELSSVVAPWQQSLNSSLESDDTKYARQYLGGTEGLRAEVNEFVALLENQRKQELGRELSGLDASILLQEWTPKKIISMIENEARTRLGVSDANQGQPEPAAQPKRTKPSQAPKTLTADINDGAGKTAPSLSGISGRKRFNEWLNQRGLKR